ncbi:hypothetical protein [Chryseobacterium sp. G0186]|nr:hypothetical protein [Chryseobacterium sp. G0186]
MKKMAGYTNVTTEKNAKRHVIVNENIPLRSIISIFRLKSAWADGVL